MSATVELKGIFYRRLRGSLFFLLTQREDHCVELGRPPIGQDGEIGNSADGIVLVGGWGCGEGVGYVFKECKLRKKRSV